jgi:hypothetical protein
MHLLLLSQELTHDRVYEPAVLLQLALEDLNANFKIQERELEQLRELRLSGLAFAKEACRLVRMTLDRMGIKTQEVRTIITPSLQPSHGRQGVTTIPPSPTTPVPTRRRRSIVPFSATTVRSMQSGISTTRLSAIAPSEYDDEEETPREPDLLRFSREDMEKAIQMMAQRFRAIMDVYERTKQVTPLEFSPSEPLEVHVVQAIMRPVLWIFSNGSIPSTEDPDKEILDMITRDVIVSELPRLEAHLMDILNDLELDVPLEFRIPSSGTLIDLLVHVGESLVDFFDALGDYRGQVLSRLISEFGIFPALASRFRGKPLPPLSERFDLEEFADYMDVERVQTLDRARTIFNRSIDSSVDAELLGDSGEFVSEKRVVDHMYTLSKRLTLKAYFNRVPGTLDDFVETVQMFIDETLGEKLAKRDLAKLVTHEKRILQSLSQRLELNLEHPPKNFDQELEESQAKLFAAAEKAGEEYAKERFLKDLSLSSFPKTAVDWMAVCSLVQPHETYSEKNAVEEAQYFCRTMTEAMEREELRIESLEEAIREAKESTKLLESNLTAARAVMGRTIMKEYPEAMRTSYRLATMF